MRSPRFRAVFLSVSTFALLALGAASAGAQLTAGKATRVGDVPPAGSNGDAIVSFTARFTAPEITDLSAVRLKLTDLLNESGPGGTAELVQGTGTALLPLTIGPRAGSRANSAIYVTVPGSKRPSVRAAIRKRADGSYQISVKLNRATIPVGPALCDGDPAETDLTTSFSLVAIADDSVVTAQSFTQAWRCQNGRLRLAPPPPAPTPVPGTPNAEIATNQLTRETGEPNLVRLDGSRSSDSDGTIASYTFSVVNRDDGTVVVAPVTQATATLEVTLPPGDYRATLTVVDNDGKTSKPASRGFTIH